MKKNIYINSNIISCLQEKNSAANPKSEKENSVLPYIDILENFEFANFLILKKDDLLFDEWDIDKNLYFIKDWFLSVEKYTSNLRNFSKQLAILKKGDFLGEWSMWWKYKKEVLVKALENTEVIAINAPKYFKEFVKKYPDIWYEILKVIIVKSNERLLEANKIISSSFEVERYINEIKKVNLKSIFWLIEHIKNIVWVDYLLFFEKHKIMDNYLIFRYDSRFSWKIQDIVFERKWYFIDLDELFEKIDISKDDKIVVNKLSIWDEVYWYLIFWKTKTSFTDSDKKIFSSISNSFSWLLKKYIEDKEELNRIYVWNWS